MNVRRVWRRLIVPLCGGIGGGAVGYHYVYGQDAAKRPSGASGLWPALPRLTPGKVHAHTGLPAPHSPPQHQGHAASVDEGCKAAEIWVHPELGQLELKQVQVFFRHGARTPLRHMPKLDEVHYDPKFLLYQLSYTDIPFTVRCLHGGPRPPSPMDKRYKAVTFKNGVTAGQLTALGQDQVYCLGRQLRRDYPNLTGQQFDPAKVWIQSTNINRCIESLKCVMSGIYGEPSFRNKEPIVISVSKFKEETLHPNLRSCPTLRAMEKRVLERENEIPGVPEITEKINQRLGLSGRQDLMGWRDHVAARKVHGLPVPPFLLELEDEIERGAINMLLTYMSGLPEDQPHSLRLTVGRAFHTVQENMDQSVDNLQTALNMCLFSCHDSTLTPLLQALHAFDGVWPPYAADLRFELWQDKSGQHWVKTRYIDKDICIGNHKKTLLTLDEFKQVLSPYVINRKDYMNQCSLSQAFWDALNDSEEQNEESPVPGSM